MSCFVDLNKWFSIPGETNVVDFIGHALFFLQTLQGWRLRRLRSFRSAVAAWRPPRVEKFSFWQTGSAWPQRV